MGDSLREREKREGGRKGGERGRRRERGEKEMGERNKGGSYFHGCFTPQRG